MTKILCDGCPKWPIIVTEWWVAVTGMPVDSSMVLTVTLVSCLKQSKKSLVHFIQTIERGVVDVTNT